MRFGEVPVAEAAGGILAHSIRTGARALKKGRLLSPEDVAALTESGISAVVVARLDADDVGEDAAATVVAEAAAGDDVTVASAFTGRVNLFAGQPGLLVVDRPRLDRFNLVDEAITLATLEPYAVVEAGQMIATVKIIPFAAPRPVVETCVALAEEGGKLLRIARFKGLRAALIQTRLPGLKESILDKTVEITRQRLEALGCRLMGEQRCEHAEAALAASIRQALAGGAELVLVAGASAIVDRRDVIPSSVMACGGRVEHFGMPVDPGNLMLLGRVDAVPVLGLPGCARSPKINGFDWVLQRLAAGIQVRPEDVMRMGAGGLLAEIPSRPLPRAQAGRAARSPAAPKIGAIVLAAGQSRRMGAVNKLLVEIDGRPMVRRAVETVLESGARPVVVVLGHEADRVRAALSGLDLTLLENPDYAHGLSTSLRRGLSALPPGLDGTFVCLGDMPFIGPDELKRLMAAFNPVEGRAICVPTRRGKRGNPVLWAARFFPEMQDASGDTGAKHLIGAHAELVAEVEMGADGVLLDIDTPQALADAASRGFGSASQRTGGTAE